LGIGPNPQSPIPNPQSPIPNPQCYELMNKYNFKIEKIMNKNFKKFYNFVK